MSASKKASSFESDAVLLVLPQYSNARPSVLKISLLYGLLKRGAANLIPTWLMQEQRLAHIQTNQHSDLQNQSLYYNGYNRRRITLQP